ncbi:MULTISPECIES: hypothetical protein [unclassified Streptomyces]|uniref:hypothetical protein n=1 Tax=unclassified Streptomyces TaxID=2593676 RepID=UPI0022519ECB|nr:MULTISPECIES: hypothetical protein [unclassified Streptomyces]MCX4548545.1 hypothetical protein [Streptomyces sp. NBC_01500]WSC20158.1 hypothetical protein OIE60_10935 [Streptomyces sp. NBC_01766]
MAHTEPESNSEVSAAAETSEEAAPGASTENEKKAGAEAAKSTTTAPAAPAAPATTSGSGAGAAKVTESGSSSPKGVAATLAGGVIGAEVPDAARATESKAPTLESAPEPMAAEKQKAEKPEPTPEPAPEAASEAVSEAVSEPAATEPETTAPLAAEPVAATATATAAAATPRGIAGLTAVLGTLTRTRTRTRTASEAVTTVDGAGNGPEGTGAAEEKSAPGKVSRPMVAAAAIGGVVLLSLPFVVASSTGGDGPQHNNRNNAAGYTDPAPGADGYVPQADASKAPLGKGSSKGSGTTGGTAGGVNAPPITEAASADNVGGGDLPADTKAGDKTPKGKTGGKTTSTKTGSDSGSDSGKQTDTKTNSSTGNGSPATPKKVSSSPTVLFSAVGGMHCSSSAVTYTEHGKYTDGQEGWTTHDGSYASGGCEGWYRSIPMSGDSDDSSNWAVWNFRTGDVKSGSCKVSVFIPNDSNVGHVGGQPTYYTVHDGTSTAGSTQLGHFTITQVSHRGQWIAAPSYKINSGVLSVKMHDRGDDWSSSSRKNAHNAAAPIRVECTK